jgi:signal transduction histidine kinase
MIAKLTHRLRHPKTTVRWRLTLMYGGLFLISGAVLLSTTYVLVSRTSQTSNQSPLQFITRTPVNFSRVPNWALKNRLAPPVARLLRSRNGRRAVAVVVSDQRTSDLHVLVIESIIALAIMAVLSMALGWVVAGWVLAPLRGMADTTREISAASLNRRLAIEGPDDELRHLGDTIDGLLARLETAFDAQRRFVANASHELRTPLTAARALLEMVLGDPNATTETFREVCTQVLEEGEQQEQLIAALLALAQGQRGIDRRQPLDLAALASAEVDRHELEALSRDVRIEAALSPAGLSGDARLIERLVSNLLENALRHNVPGGHVELTVSEEAGKTTLTIVNTGHEIAQEQLERLTQPFQRLAPDRTGYRDGLGLGLSIVEAIATAHDATLELQARDGGGLQVTVRFPTVSATPQSDAASAESIVRTASMSY